MSKSGCARLKSVTLYIQLIDETWYVQIGMMMHATVLHNRSEPQEMHYQRTRRMILLTVNLKYAKPLVSSISYQLPPLAKGRPRFNP